MSRSSIIILVSGIALAAFSAGVLTDRAFLAKNSNCKSENSNSSALAPLAYEHGDIVPFGELINQKTGHKVITYSSDNPTHKLFAKTIQQAADEALLALSADKSPTKGLSRINEASRHFEDYLLATISKNPDFTCQVPNTSENKAQRTGYPDLLMHHLPSDTYAYLDPKLVASGSETSSLRSFYYQGRQKTSKIHHDALHFVIGFFHDGNNGNWRFTSWKLVDLSLLPLKLKSEFSSTNREMYEQTKSSPLILQKCQ